MTSCSTPSERHASVFASLDRWRIVLALVVVVLHAQSLGWLNLSTHQTLYRVAHDAVIGFFVISGYSVMQAAARGGFRAGPFLAGRFSRLYSLVAPALVLTLCLDLVGRSLQPDLYPLWVYPKWYLHLGFHGLFLSENWLWSLPAFSNVPYWSLAYEAWYYLLLAAVLVKPERRLLLVMCVLLLMGPRMLLLLPCWLIGVAAWHLVQRGNLPTLSDRIIPGAALLLLYLAWIASPAYEGLRQASQAVDRLTVHAIDADLRLHYSQWFLADWITALLFAVMIVGVGALRNSRPDANPAWVHFLAFHSFGIYLLHYPVLLLLKAMWPGPQPAGVAGAVLVFGVVVVCVGLSWAFSMTRSVWQGLFGQGVRFVQGRSGR